ncbi:hypothetical protein C364_02229 [Cryptococcus neoformans Bt63]|nr:hypothetical protein C364_02229 [Cryptococcus neoformans var. grubii Bt63]
MRTSITYCCFVFSLIALCVRADTEIINFRLPLPPHTTTYPTPDSLVYTISPYEALTLNLTDSSPERWFALDMGNMKGSYKSWTLRASWPGSSPTKITLSPPLSPGYFTLHAAALSPRFPHHPPVLPYIPYMNHLTSFISSLLTIPPPKPKLSDDQFHTPLHLTLEPLLFGFLPYTALPAVGLIILFVTVAGMGVPYVIRGLEWAGNWAQAEDRRRGEGERERVKEE